LGLRIGRARSHLLPSRISAEPERVQQVRGITADARADIFAVGAILYELLSGQRAFRGTTSADTMTAILKEAPADLTAGARPIANCMRLQRRPRRAGGIVRVPSHATRLSECA
jgi:serine/threonine protein kinase